MHIDVCLLHFVSDRHEIIDSSSKSCQREMKQSHEKAITARFESLLQRNLEFLF